MNFEAKGEQIAVIYNKDRPTKKMLSIESEPDDKPKVKFYEDITLQEGRFQLIPIIPKLRTSIFIVGRNGSGKSYYIARYLEVFIKMYPHYQIRLFSSKDEDEELDSFPQIKRIKFDQSFIDQPIDYTVLKESLCIFDDVDGLEKKMRDAIYQLRDIILKNGRSYRIHIISTNHDSVGRDVQAPLNESDVIVFFMKNYNRSLQYLLERYIGLSTEQIKKLKKIKSRACAYIKSYPNVLLLEKSAFTFDGLDGE